MGGIHSYVVGYDKRDAPRRRLSGADIYGGKCISCSRECFYNTSAIEVLRNRDARPVCFACGAKYPEELRLEL